MIWTDNNHVWKEKGPHGRILTMRYAYIDDKVEKRLIMQMSVGKGGGAPEAKTIENAKARSISRETRDMLTLTGRRRRRVHLDRCAALSLALMHMRRMLYCIIQDVE